MWRNPLLFISHTNSVVERIWRVKKREKWGDTGGVRVGVGRGDGGGYYNREGERERSVGSRDKTVLLN